MDNNLPEFDVEFWTTRLEFMSTLMDCNWDIRKYSDHEHVLTFQQEVGAPPYSIFGVGPIKLIVS